MQNQIESSEGNAQTEVYATNGGSLVTHMSLCYLRTNTTKRTSKHG